MALAILVAISVLAASQQQSSAHPVHDFGGPAIEILKGRSYDGIVEPVSPGGVPMTAMSDTRCTGGMAGIFPCHKVDLASFLPLPDLEATFVNDVWGWTDSATGMQVAIVGSFEGTAFVDVTDGINPVYLGTLPSSAPGDGGNIWGDIPYGVTFASMRTRLTSSAKRSTSRPTTLRLARSTGSVSRSLI